MAKYKMHILICGGTGCKSSNSLQIIDNFHKILAEKGLADDVQVIKTGCFGFCEKGPIVKIMPDNTFYTQVKPEDVERIVNEHIIKGRKVPELLYTNPENKEHVSDSKHMDFYRKQIRIALRNCGFVDPENIEESISRGGYEALAKCLTEMTPQQVIDEITKSGLRGRGGAGFPTGVKWGLCAKNQADQKYIICNADEGDPGAFMDRSILEGDPNSIVEAMAIGGYAIGASKGLVYIRAEYPLAIDRLKIAIKQAREYGLLGEDILGTGFNFDIELRYGAGAFVCGEETALIHSMEGKRGEPTLKPPFPAVRGYMDKPSNVNNVETFANIPVIITKGADWFRTIGTEKSPGTKVFALAGQINNVGLIEVPMGITLREIIYEIGGGIKDGREFKAVQTGGPSGGCLTAKHLDTEIDYDSLVAAGSMMGSGGMVVMDETSCPAKRAAVSAAPAASATSASASFSRRLPTALAPWTTSTPSATWPPSSRTAPSAVSARLRRTPCSPPSTTSGTSTSSTSSTRSAALASARNSCSMSSTPRSASVAESAPRTAPPKPSPVPTTLPLATSWLRWSSVKRNVSSAVPATRIVSLVPSRLNNL